MVRPPMRTREEIRADVQALEKETKGLSGGDARCTEAVGYDMMQGNREIGCGATSTKTACRESSDCISSGRRRSQYEAAP